jgi:hypothetical protein
MFGLILMGMSMIDGITLFLVWDAQKKICTIQWRYIAKDKIMEGSNDKGDDTTLYDHETRSFLMNPP